MVDKKIFILILVLTLFIFASFKPVFAAESDNSLFDKFMKGFLDVLFPLNKPQFAPSASPSDPLLVRGCTDQDRDGYNLTEKDCGIIDCNDNQSFYNPLNGTYCNSYTYLELLPYDNWPAADFALYYNGTYLHSYYIRGHIWTTDPTHGKSFGHEKTNDLMNWDFVSEVLSVSEVSDGEWDDDHVWAPNIIKNGSIYYMFYTGVTNAHPTPNLHQERIGIATSSDLDNWVRYPINNCDGTIGDGCLLDCNFTWSSWQDSSWTQGWNYACKDPFVFWDENNQAWYMLYVTGTNPYNWNSVVGLGKSTDLINWEDLGPITQTTGSVESPHLVFKNGLYYIFWSSMDGGVFYMYSANIDSGSWSSPTIIPGSLAGFILASESIEQNNYDLFAYIYDFVPRTIRFKTINVTSNLNLGNISSLDCYYVNPAFVHPGAPEICNGLDDNCAFGIDEDPFSGGSVCQSCSEEINGWCACGSDVYYDGYCCNGVWQPIPCAESGLDSFDLVLESGWNFVSIPLSNLQNNDSSLLEADILLSYDSDYGWNMNYKTINQIPDLETSKGYIVYNNGSRKTITFAGELASINYPLSPIDWNLIGVTQNSLIGDIYGAGEYSVYYWDGNNFVAENNLLIVGESYWVHIGIVEAPEMSFWDRMLGFFGL